MQGAPCLPDSHPYRVTGTKCHIDTVISPDDGHIIARNIYRKEINILKKLCTKLALSQDLLNHQYNPTCHFRRHALFLQKTQEICIKPRSVVAITPPLQYSLTFNCNLLHTHMKATHCRCKSVMLHKHTTSFLRKVRPLMGKSCPSFKRTNALIQYGNNFSAYDYLIQLPFSLL